MDKGTIGDGGAASTGTKGGMNRGKQDVPANVQQTV